MPDKRHSLRVKVYRLGEGDEGRIVATFPASKLEEAKEYAKSVRPSAVWRREGDDWMFVCGFLPKEEAAELRLP